MKTEIKKTLKTIFPIEIEGFLLTFFWPVVALAFPPIACEGENANDDEHGAEGRCEELTPPPSPRMGVRFAHTSR